MGKLDKIILGAVAVTAILLMGIFFWIGHSGDGHSYALVSINGENIMELDLSKEADQLIDLGEYGVDVVLEIKDHRIAFRSSDCPDHVCIGFGWIDHEPQSAVCMPNRVAITISPVPN